MSKPNEFYIGVVELFAILVPGSIAIAVFAPLFAELGLSSAVEYPRNDLAQWVAFAIGAYAAGHVIFFLASFLDDWADALRRRIQRHIEARDKKAAKSETQHTPESRGDSSAKPFHRHAGNRRAHDDATKIRRSLLTSDQGPSVNSYQWARAALMLRLPSAADDVQRIEADAKLFRSLVVVFLLAGVVFCKEHRLAASLSAPSFSSALARSDITNFA